MSTEEENIEEESTEEEQTGGMWVWHRFKGSLVTKIDDSIKARVAHIKATKPKNEQATRIKAIKPVENVAKLEKILNDYAEAKVAAQKAYDAITVAAKAKRNKALEALHEKECDDDCPWDGETLVFPAK